MHRNIRRIVFTALSKWDGTETLPVAPSQVKQIAGRAGRFGTTHDRTGGILTTLRREDMAYLAACMAAPGQAVGAAGLLPTSDHIVNMAHASPGLSLAHIIELYQQHAQLADHYVLGQFRDLRRTVGLLEAFPGLAMRDRFQLACAPVKRGDALVQAAFATYVRHLAEDRPCAVHLAPPALGRGTPQAALQMAESVYRALDLYLWLATHFPAHFGRTKEAHGVREACARVVSEALTRICHVRAGQTQTRPPPPRAPRR